MCGCVWGKGTGLPTCVCLGGGEVQVCVLGLAVAFKCRLGLAKGVSHTRTVIALTLFACGLQRVYLTECVCVRVRCVHGCAWVLGVFLVHVIFALICV